MGLGVDRMGLGYVTMLNCRGMVMLYLIERLDGYRWTVRKRDGHLVGFAVSDGVIWVSVTLSGCWSVHDCLRLAMSALIDCVDVA